MPASDPTPQPNWLAKNWPALLGLAGWLIAVVLFATGKTDKDPGPPPLIPITQAVPPGHTAVIETDPAGQVRMSVSPNP